VEDISMNLINSRKLGTQSLITLTAQVEELYDEEAPIAVHGDEKVEYRRMPLDLAQIAICKNDIFRLKEEVALPSNYPNIFQILWSNLSLGDMEFKVMEEKIAISGDIHLFVLYEGEGEDPAAALRPPSPSAACWNAMAAGRGCCRTSAAIWGSRSCRCGLISMGRSAM
jgi:hypothetical protein